VKSTLVHSFHSFLLLVAIVGLLSGSPQYQLGSISGAVVMGKESTPVADAKIVLLPLENRRCVICPSTVSGKDGRFLITDVPAGHFHLELFVSGGVPS